MANRVDYRLRYQVREDTPPGKLFKYLMSNDTEFAPRQMVLSALKAFWYPLACKWSGGFEEDRLQAIARLSIYDLRQQINYLARAFGLEQELVDFGVPCGVEQSPDGVSAAVPAQITPAAVEGNGFGNKEEEPTSTPELPEIIQGNPEDDALLDQMFK